MPEGNIVFMPQISYASSDSTLSDILVRLHDLEEENKRLKDEIESLQKGLQAGKMWTLPTRVDDLWEWVEELEANQRARNAVSRSTANEYIEKLYTLMQQSGMAQISISNAAKILGCSITHAHRLKQTITSDKRFVLVKDPHHKQRHLIRLVKGVRP